MEFKFFGAAIGLTRGNLSSHLSKLEAAGYLTVRKAFRDRMPVTSYRISPEGRRALEAYRRCMVDGLVRPARTS